jgi:hypothetical protein
MRKMVNPDRWQNFPHEDLKIAIRWYWQNEVKPKYTEDYEHDFPDSEYVHMTKIDNINYKLCDASAEGAERVLGVTVGAFKAPLMRKYGSRRLWCYPLYSNPVQSGHRGDL